MLDQLIGARPVEGILTGHVRLTLGGVIYEVPDLPNAANRRWLAAINGAMSATLDALEAAGDDTPAILQALMAASDELLDLLVGYDQGIAPDGGPLRLGVLDRERIDETATPAEILRAVLEVWQAANPLVVTALAGGLPAATAGTSSGPTRRSRRGTGGRTTTSRTG